MVLPLVLAFGTEGYLEPHDSGAWHHFGITRRAAAEAGWAQGAGTELAFAADVIDRYLWDPAWLYEGGMARVRAAREIAPALRTLHMDDLTTPELVEASFERVLTGTRVAIRWCAEAAGEHAVAAVRGVVGFALHCVQDFYSHSTWINAPQRRGITWDERIDAGVEYADLEVGRYQVRGAPRHGAIGLAGPGRAAVRIPLRGGIGVPAGIAGIGRGVTLDSRWQAPTGVRTRGIAHEVSGEEAFEMASELAERHSARWLRELALEAQALGLDALWERVMHDDDGGAHAQSRVAQDPRLRPHLFLGAGASAGREPDPDAWFLRVTARRRDGQATSRVLGPFPAAGGRLAQDVTDGARAVARHPSVVGAWAFRRGGSADLLRL
ncbi:hypothetical protein [Serinibacter salmoneus]|uniref:Uncharacterized protein n=1 Tax=Serinibacter salmoneus TaxID=556530 RepID=A0A2A9D650_9MICO|nr:hypothetical protein [Serinibacter salmoneus]PFG21320.1 hypothetical protein ATL40_2947 [Serinibacter salmoneus]